MNAPAALDATSRPDLAGAFDARRALRVLGSVVVVGSGLVGLHLITGIGLPCPLLTSLGMYCPFCGSTRAAESVLRGDLAAAWGWNPILLIALVVTGLAAIAWTVEVAGGPALRPPSIIRPLTQTKVYAAVAVLLTTFMIVRNIW